MGLVQSEAVEGVMVESGEISLHVANLSAGCLLYLYRKTEISNDDEKLLYTHTVEACAD